MPPLRTAEPIPRREAVRLGVRVVVRVVVSVLLLFTAFFAIPTLASRPDRAGWWLLLELAVFGLVVGIQVPAIVRARYPVLRAVEATAVVIPLYLVIFARIYLEVAASDPTAFSEPLDTTAALYFTVTVFATVGFGDIVPVAGSMRLLVTAQMLVNLVVLGAVVRLLASAARRGVQRKFQGPDAPDEPV